jgi:Holliday junction resolvasome RuvABC endonuclease subunit
MINLESIAYGAKGRTTDLAMLLGAIYYSCLKKGIKTNLVAPTQLKKSFCDNGRASKDDMIYFMRDNFTTEFNKFKSYKKIDDLVDAFALSVYL